MKKRIKIFAVTSVLLLICIALTACGVSYGDSYTDMDKLQQKLESEGLQLKYPDFSGEGEYDVTYVATYDNENKKYIGYKIYHLCSPFYVSIYSYVTPSDKILSDDADKLTLENNSLITDKGTAKLYSGETKEGNLYLISSIVIDGVQYEVRVVNDKTMKDGEFVNAITRDNGNYEKAEQLIVDVIKTIK